MTASFWPRMDRGWVSFFGHFKTQPLWAVLIALINVVGIAYGFYYYRAQFAVTPVWLWPFVPDSPLAVLWAELALLLSFVRAKPGVFDVLAVVGNVQVGLWTVYVLTAYADTMGTFRLSLNTILLGAHAAMALLGLIFLSGLRRRRRTDARGFAWAVALGGAYYLVNDALDYFGPDYLGTGCGLRPYTVPCDASMEGALTAVTFALTVLGLVLVVWGARTGPTRT